MKSLFLLLAGACIIAQLNAAAVNTSVEEEHTDATVVDGSLVTAEDCHQPREVGRCFALFYRYAFNVESRKCEEFIYGGCNGNKNNFESMEDCERKCIKSLDDVAAVPKAEENAVAAKAAEEPIETASKSTETSD